MLVRVYGDPKDGEDFRSRIPSLIVEAPKQD